MLNSAIFDTAIGLIFVFLVMSLLASAFREVAESFMKQRAKELENGIRTLLDDPTGQGLTTSIYQHPLIDALFEGSYSSAGNKRQLPSYIPSANFALALMDEVVRGKAAVTAGPNGPTRDVDASAAAPPISVLNLRRSVASIGNIKVQRVLLTALDTAQDDLSRVQTSLEAWYDSAMDRVSGRYKRRTQLWLIGIGLVLAIVANVNTVRIARHLYYNKTARDVVVAQATAAAKDPTILTADHDRLAGVVDSLSLPMGWPDGVEAGLVDSRMPGASPGGADVASAILGWIMTALAVSLGAPFWFDLLNRFTMIRSSMKPPQKSPDESPAGRSLAPVAPSGAAPRTPDVSGGGGLPAGTTAVGVDSESPNTWADGSTAGDL